MTSHFSEFCVSLLHGIVTFRHFPILQHTFLSVAIPGASNCDCSFLRDIHGGRDLRDHGADDAEIQGGGFTCT